MRNEFGEALDSNGYAPSVWATAECWYAAHRGRLDSPCNCRDLIRHEVFHGSRRDISKRYGAWVTLCPLHHGYVHSYPQCEKGLKQETQKLVMERYGWSEARFRQSFGKSYV